MNTHHIEVATRFKIGDRVAHGGSLNEGTITGVFVDGSTLRYRTKGLANPPVAWADEHYSLVPPVEIGDIITWGIGGLGYTVTDVEVCESDDVIVALDDPFTVATGESSTMSQAPIRRNLNELGDRRKIERPEQPSFVTTYTVKQYGGVSPNWGVLGKALRKGCAQSVQSHRTDHAERFETVVTNKDGAVLGSWTATADDLRWQT